MTRAVPSLTRLSARRVVAVRRGRHFVNAPTAIASVGATAAPSTQAGPHGIPSRCATAAAVVTTRTVLVSTMPRRFALVSLSDVVRLSQDSNAVS